jgi:hypothetical protein
VDRTEGVNLAEVAWAAEQYARKCVQFIFQQPYRNTQEVAATDLPDLIFRKAGLQQRINSSRQPRIRTLNGNRARRAGRALHTRRPASSTFSRGQESSRGGSVIPGQGRTETSRGVRWNAIEPVNPVFNAVSTTITAQPLRLTANQTLSWQVSVKVELSRSQLSPVGNARLHSESPLRLSFRRLSVQ